MLRCVMNPAWRRAGAEYMIWAFLARLTEGLTVTILWRKQLNTGNHTIDAEHRFLVCLINTVELAVRTGEGVEVIGDAVAQLSDYTQQHFEHEERIMLALNYVRYDAHRAAHEALRARLKKLAAEIAGCTGKDIPKEAADQLMGLLRAWLIDHIIKEDFLMKSMLAEQDPHFAG